MRDFLDRDDDVRIAAPERDARIQRVAASFEVGAVAGFEDYTSNFFAIRDALNNQGAALGRACLWARFEYQASSSSGSTRESSAEGASAACFFKRTIVIFAKPSSNLGGRSFCPMRCMISSGALRARIRLRSMQTSVGTSKKTA